MRSLFAATTLACALLFFGSPAKASYILDMPVTASPTKHQRAQATHNHQQKPSRVAERPQAAPVWTASIFSAVITRAESASPAPASISGDVRPPAWCGWYMRQLFDEADHRLNLAINWARIWGHAVAGPHIGAIAVWSFGNGHGHVALIRAGPDRHGRWMTEGGNEDNAVRIHWRSLAGAFAFRSP